MIFFKIHKYNLPWFFMGMLWEEWARFFRLGPINWRVIKKTLFSLKGLLITWSLWSYYHRDSMISGLMGLTHFWIWSILLWMTRLLILIYPWVFLKNQPNIKSDQKRYTKIKYILESCQSQLSSAAKNNFLLRVKSPFSL